MGFASLGFVWTVDFCSVDGVCFSRSQLSPPSGGVCVKTPRNTVKWFFNNFTAGGRRGWGGVSGQRRHPPPPGANVPAFPFFRWIAGAKLRTLSIYFPGTTTTGLFLRWWAILGPCYIYFKWGLLHIDALPRTTPDNHVELSSVCVCVYVCVCVARSPREHLTGNKKNVAGVSILGIGEVDLPKTQTLNLNSKNQSKTLKT